MLYNEGVIEQILTANGFSAKEATVYLAVLEAGEISVSRIAGKTHLKRTSVYDILETLKERGVVSVTKRKGVQYVSALSPRNLIGQFKQAASLAEDALPQLMEMAYSSPLKPRMRFYEGIDGLKEILRDMSFSKTQTLGFTDYDKMPKEMFTFIRKEVVPERRKRKNHILLIVPRNERNLQVQTEDEIHFGEHRIVDFPDEKNHIEILLYDSSKVGFLSFKEDERFGVVIDSPAIYQTLKNLFYLVWGQAEKGG